MDLLPSYKAAPAVKLKKATVIYLVILSQLDLKFPKSCPVLVKPIAASATPVACFTY